MGKWIGGTVAAVVVMWYTAADAMVDFAFSKLAASAIIGLFV